MDISTLETRYLDSCKRHLVPSNSAILAWFSEAKVHKSLHEKCSITVFLDHITVADVPPLIDVFLAIDSFDIDAVDIVHESLCPLNEGYIMSLLRAISLKLQLVDLQDASIGKDFLRDLCEDGLACQVLNLRTTHIRKLNMIGKFMQLHTLNLDFCTSLTSLQKDCFSCMPNLKRLSMCETRVANLWTTTAVLSNLPSLVELRFQNCLCCKDTGPCPAFASSGEKAAIDGRDAAFKPSGVGEAVKEYYYLDDSYMSDDSLEESETELSDHLLKLDLLEPSSNILPDLNGQVTLQNEIRDTGGSHARVLKRNLTDASILSQKYISHHPSPICFEKHYREYVVASLPRLEVLDNLRIIDMEREMAKAIFSKHYEYMPYRRQRKESVVSILHKREMGTSGMKCQKSFKAKQPYGKSQCYFSRSLTAAKLGSSTWPLTQPVSNFSQILKEEGRRLRPRQFEYHPAEPSLMAFGTLDGEIVVINHESGSVVGHVPSIGATNSILGLCWLKKHPSKLIAGSDDGSLMLFDINSMAPRVADICCRTSAVNFDHFEQLTSVHVNSTDEQFLVSGYSKNIALYDITSGKRLHLFANLHREPINVAKFSHHSPFTFVTSSFDHDVKMWDLRMQPLRPCYTTSSLRGNVMVCFSPDDHYLLVSAVDNEVKQLLAVDGRLHMDFEIASTGSAHNYTRSYYMNGKDYVIMGEIPQGLPKFSVPKEFGYVKSLIPTAFLITGVAILESVGIAKALAAKNGYELDSNQELFGLGLANICGSFFSAYPTTGSFSRSAVNHESGARTGLSGIISGIIMTCALLFLTPIFQYIPQCVLAAIVIAAVMGLVDYDKAIFLWRVDKKDFLLWTITSTATLFLGIEIGVLVGVGVSLAFVIHESANPHIAVLGRLPGTTVYRNIQQYPEAYTYHGIVIVRLDAPIYFANISYIKDRLREYELDVDKSTRRGPEVERIHFVIIEMAPVTYIDSSAVQALKDLHHEYKSRDIKIAISNPNREVLLTLSKSGVVDLIGKEWFFVRVHDAVQVCLQHVQSLTETPKASESLVEGRPSYLQRLLRERGEDLSIFKLESGELNQPEESQETDPQLEPLLSKKP